MILYIFTVNDILYIYNIYNIYIILCTIIATGDAGGLCLFPSKLSDEAFDAWA